MARDVAGALEKIRVQVEAAVGEPVTAVLPYLSGSGATLGVGLAQASSGLGWLQNRKANQAGGGAAALTFTKNRYGLLVLTGAGRLELYRTKGSARGPKLEDLVAGWAPGEVRVGIERSHKLITVTLDRADEPPLAYEIIDVMGAITMVEPFARAIGVTIT